ncbi:phage tail tube protein, partial [Chengkuizengella marina]
MSRPNADKIIVGTYGKVWVDGELWAEVISFEAKVTVTYEDVNFAGYGSTFKKATGWTGEGSMTINKIYSRVQRKMADNVKKG